MPEKPNIVEPVKNRFRVPLPSTVKGLIVAGFGLLTLILSVGFVVEYLIMLFVMPAITSSARDPGAGLADSALMTLISAPVFWWFIARHGRAAQALRRNQEHLHQTNAELERKRRYLEGAHAELAEAHRQLGETSVRLDAVLANVPEVIYSADHKTGTITFISDAIRQYGYEPSELVDRPGAWLVTVHPDDLDQVRAALAEGLSARDAFSVEYRFRDASGKYHNVRNSMQPKKGFTQNAVLVDGVITDITAVIEAEEALRESEERFRKIFEEGPLGMAVVGLDYRFQRVNAAFCEMTGYSEGELKERTFAGITHPGDIEADVRQAERLMAGEIPDYQMEKRYIRKDGTIVWINLAGSIVRAGDGAPLHFLAQAENITVRKRLEALKAAQFAVTQVLAESATVAEAAPNLLRAICEGLGWELGEMWRVDAGPGVLRCQSTWYPPELDMKEIEEAARTVTFARSAGLPGHAWAAEQPVWVADVTGDPNFVRAPIATKYGLHRAIAFPVRAGSEITGVMAFFGRDIREPDEQLLETAAHIGSQVGQFIARKEAEHALRESEERLRTVVSNAPIILWAIDNDGAVLTSRGKGLEALGIEPEATIGQNVFDLYRDAPDIVDAHRRALAGEHQAVQREMAGRVFESQYTPVRDTDGRVSGVIAIAFDITERKRAEETLRASEERTRLVVETAYDALISIDAEGVVTTWNAAAESMFGWSREEAIGRTLAETIIPEQLRKAHVKGLKRFLATGEGPVLNKRIEITALRRDGQEFPVELAVWPVQVGPSRSFNAFVHDISDRKAAEGALKKLNEELEREQHEVEALNRSLEEKVRERTLELRSANDELRDRNRQLLDARFLAATDALTGLPNHRSFHERVRGEVVEAEVAGASVGLLMLDIDGFKNVNDSRGHLAGDQILRELAATLCTIVKRDDTYRYGGDEFAVLLPGADNTETVATAERLRQAVAKNLSHNGSKLTISLGAAAFPHSAETVEELIYGADSAMYSAKFAGKNRVGTWDRGRTQRLDGRSRSRLESEDAAADSISALIAALTAKDPQTCAHGTRCSWYATKTAEELGLPPEERAIVKTAALLHDIGKLAIREDVLFKPSALNEEEWVEMRRHPRVGRDILAHVRVVSGATPAVLHHHERYDGQGYPDGLKGADIPIASRILLVTDAFDAMVTDRPYRKALPIDAAIEELKRFSGTQFDPKVVETFLRIIERGDASPLHQVTHKKEKARAHRGAAKEAANGIPHGHDHAHPEEATSHR